MSKFSLSIMEKGEIMIYKNYLSLSFSDCWSYIEQLSHQQIVDELLDAKNLLFEFKTAYEVFKGKLFNFTCKHDKMEHREINDYCMLLNSSDEEVQKEGLKQYLHYLEQLGRDMDGYLEELDWNKVTALEVVSDDCTSEDLFDEIISVRWIYDKLVLLKNAAYIIGSRGYRDMFDHEYEFEDLQDRRFDVYNIFGLDNCWAVLREYEPFELLERLEKMFRHDCSY